MKKKTYIPKYYVFSFEMLMKIICKQLIDKKSLNLVKN